MPFSPARRLQARLGGQSPFMPVLRAVARPMVASIFIIQGFDTFRRPERVAAAAEPVVRPIADRVPVVPAKAEQAVRLNGAVQMAAGSMLALGRWPRLSAIAIAGTLVPTTLAGHRFWEAEDDASKAQQRIHFLKNLSMLGGLLIAAVDTEGKPSIAWRVRHAVKSARSARQSAARRPGPVRGTAKSARKSVASARGSVASARGSAKSAGKEASRVASSVRKDTARVAQSARKDASRMARSARRDASLALRTAKASGKAGARAAKASGKVGFKAGRLVGRVSR
jgi:putative oxidoreductase